MRTAWPRGIQLAMTTKSKRASKAQDASVPETGRQIGYTICNLTLPMELVSQHTDHFVGGEDQCGAIFATQGSKAAPDFQSAEWPSSIAVTRGN